MTVNLTGGIDYTQWKPVEIKGTSLSKDTTTNSIEYENDSFVSSSGEKCTDGKDDGKIGLFSAIGNAIKGVGKTIVNGVKGMFTNSEGKFSLGKTLLSVGTAALCIAVPAVGVAACAVGGVMGAVQVGKGIYNAATADTDAEAKEAWQNIGGGAFTVAASAVGAKAGVKAVKATSSAGGAKGVSALSQLDDGASIGQKAVALGKDMVSSTKNQYSSIKTNATAYAQAAKLKYAEAKASKIDTSSALTNKELHTIKNAEYQRMFASDDTLSALDKIDDVSNTIKSYADTAQTTVTEVAKHPIKSAQSAWSSIQENIKNVKLSDVKTELSELGGNATKIFTKLKEGGYNQAIKEFGESEVAQVIEIVAGVTYAKNSM